MNKFLPFNSNFVCMLYMLWLIGLTIWLFTLEAKIKKLSSLLAGKGKDSQGN